MKLTTIKTTAIRKMMIHTSIMIRTFPFVRTSCSRQMLWSVVEIMTVHRSNLWSNRISRWSIHRHLEIKQLRLLTIAQLTNQSALRIS